MSARTPKETPTPMPAFAPLLRLVLGCGATEAPVAVALAAAAFEVVEDEIMVGMDVDVVAAVIDVDHVVAGRSDLWFFRVSIPV